MPFDRTPDPSRHIEIRPLALQAAGLIAIVATVVKILVLLPLVGELSCLWAESSQLRCVWCAKHAKPEREDDQVGQATGC